MSPLKVWALSLTAGNAGDGFEHNSTYSIFTVTVVLTKAGFENLDNVLAAVFSYLKMMERVGVSERIFKEIKEIEIIDSNGERIAPAKLNNNLQTMYQRLQAGRFQCNNCGKVLSSRQKIMVHLEAHLGLSLPCPVLENISQNS